MMDSDLKRCIMTEKIFVVFPDSKRKGAFILKEEYTGKVAFPDRLPEGVFPGSAVKCAVVEGKGRFYKVTGCQFVPPYELGDNEPAPRYTYLRGWVEDVGECQVCGGRFANYYLDAMTGETVRLHDKCVPDEPLKIHGFPAVRLDFRRNLRNTLGVYWPKRYTYGPDFRPLSGEHAGAHSVYVAMSPNLDSNT